MLIQVFLNYITLTAVIILCIATDGSYSADVGAEDQNIVLEMRNSETDHRRVIVYKHNTQDFEDINMLFANLSDNGNWYYKICMKGTWLMYDRPHLVNRKVGTREGLWIYSVDKYTCYNKQELDPKYFYKGFNGSIQPVTTYRKRDANTITFFQYENFVGRRMAVNKHIKPHNEEPTNANYINSLITVGKKEWILQMDNIRMCFQPIQTMKLPICLLTNLIDNINTFPGGPLEVRQAKNGCDEPDLVSVPLTNCFENNVGFIKNISISWPFGPPPNETIGNKCTDEEDILKDEHVDLIAARLNGTLGSGDWFSAIKDPKDIWKAELFDKCFQVFSKICPDSVIENEYLLLFASLYWLHLGSLWTDGKFKNVSISEIEWMQILYDMNACVETVTGGDYDGIAVETATDLQTYKSLDDINSMFSSSLGVKPDNDHVMEINWLMGNLVASICTKARDFDVNFLPRFLNIFHVLYLSPVEAQWTKPGDYASIYKYIFGGYGMKKSLAQISLCTFNAMKFSGLTEPYKRPMDQTDKILLPKAPEIR